jgi:hypothetical protein
MNLEEIGLVQLSTIETQETEGGLIDWGLVATGAAFLFGMGPGIVAVGMYNAYHSHP